ncbi:phosphatidylserine decarboxylase [Halomicrobium salinisoli]|uniref:phosphatidylserine decarboxylase n=1 Tax=Halomicrobium salinisoli TaxID=2878391 RepID=UPI001CEFCA72|nr:phosphatidylserine decarboxylase [Halomicrobium salinisoli]
MRFARGSLRWAAIPALAALAALVLWLVPAVPVPWQSSAVFGAATLGVLVFHRDPDRETPPAGVVAPADGRVAVIREEDDGRLRLGIYMRGRDVHVNRAPMDGVVEAVEHEPGANKLAFRKESERNERLRFSFREGASEASGLGTSERGAKRPVSSEADRGEASDRASGSERSERTASWEAEQIAGAFARRTYSYVEPGEDVERGQRIGHISFSSRFDLVFPPEYDREDLAIDLGHRVYAGETVVARARADVREATLGAAAERVAAPSA